MELVTQIPLLHSCSPLAGAHLPKALPLSGELRLFLSPSSDPDQEDSPGELLLVHVIHTECFSKETLRMKVKLCSQLRLPCAGQKEGPLLMLVLCYEWRAMSRWCSSLLGETVSVTT